jgi:Kef-type K+ transport system membrane component KefB
MTDLATATILAALILVASIVSVEFGISVAIIEIGLGVVGANLLALRPTPWIDFIGTFAGIVLTFLAGAEVDRTLLRREWKPALLIGGLSFLLPFVGVGLFARYVAGWDARQSQIAGIALSTTSLAVVYAVLVETGLTATELGKILMAATFVTDLETALALSVLFVQPTPYLALFIVVSIGVIALMVILQQPFFARYGARVIEPEIKGAFLALFVLMWTADLAKSHAVLPAFLLGLAVADVFKRHPEEHRRFRVVSFAFLTPIFFLKGGLNVEVGHLAAGGRLLLAFLGVKIATKFIGVLPAALRYVRPHAMFTTLLMSTGLTFGTISSLYGLNAGIIDRQQFTILIGAVIGSAIVPTVIAQQWFAPPVHDLTAEEIAQVEDEEFEPPRRFRGATSDLPRALTAAGSDRAVARLPHPEIDQLHTTDSPRKCVWPTRQPQHHQYPSGEIFGHLLVNSFARHARAAILATENSTLRSTGDSVGGFSFVRTLDIRHLRYTVICEDCFSARPLWTRSVYARACTPAYVDTRLAERYYFPSLLVLPLATVPASPDARSRMSPTRA